MTNASADWSFWDVVLAAHADGARTVHFAAGRPPMMRVDRGELVSIPGYPGEISQPALMRELSMLVEPERWDAIEANGSGEVALPEMTGRPVRLSLFASQQHWVAVVYL